MAMLRGAIVNESAAEQLRSFIQSRLLEGTRERTDTDAALRAGLASSMLVGVVTSRRIIGVPTLVEADTEELVAPWPRPSNRSWSAHPPRPAGSRRAPARDCH